MWRFSDIRHSGVDAHLQTLHYHQKTSRDVAGQNKARSQMRGYRFYQSALLVLGFWETLLTATCNMLEILQTLLSANILNRSLQLVYSPYQIVSSAVSGRALLLHWVWEISDSWYLWQGACELHRKGIIEFFWLSRHHLTHYSTSCRRYLHLADIWVCSWYPVHSLRIFFELWMNLQGIVADHNISIWGPSAWSRLQASLQRRWRWLAHTQERAMALLQSQCLNSVASG